ncbi:MAG TPA: TM0106 family RecB-like putative nuclease [Deltaproteobacteria bacterium]|nr:TM0106 family RecB-like putative nuclease [Deltaproteobacteria bacterium]
MTRPITASMLYNLVQCPHRLFLDLHEDPAKKDPESKFVELLWERGTTFEKEVMTGVAVPFLDLSGEEDAAKERLTMEAISRGEPLIYGGRIRSGDLLGEPDLMRRQAGGYIAGDIKSGSGFEDASDDLSDGKPKKHYAVQLGLYNDILEKMGVSAGRTPFIWDVHGREVTYDLDTTPGPRTPETLWSLYQDSLAQAKRIVFRSERTLPAYSGTCKLCHWNSFCKHHLRKADDLTLVPELGRAKRDVMLSRIRTVAQFAGMDITPLISGKKTVFAGIGSNTLRKLQKRALLLADDQSQPYIKTSPPLPDIERELFFDIETDPMRDICYLHGFVERLGRDNSSERHLPFLAETATPEGEREAFRQAWEYVCSSRPAAMYFYSKYERTWWRILQQRYPDIATAQQIEELFDPATAVDLYYDVVLSCTEWPTNDYSIKTLATYLGFNWRDKTPSGAESIEWYNRWVETGDPMLRSRILEYNEDDCIATRVLLDGIRSLPGPA